MHRRLIIAGLLTLLAGCGFHLRGAVPLPEAMARTFIAAPASSPLRYELEGLLLSAGGEVVEEQSQASAVLTVHSARIRSRVLSVDSQGRAREYGLRLSVSYSLSAADGTALARERQERVERAFRFDPDNVLARDAERETLQQEMYRRAAEQMVRRLRRLAAATP